MNEYRSSNSLSHTLSLCSLKRYLKYFERYDLDLHLCDVYTVKKEIGLAFAYCYDV